MSKNFCKEDAIVAVVLVTSRILIIISIHTAMIFSLTFYQDRLYSHFGAIKAQQINYKVGVEVKIQKNIYK